RDLTVTGVQTCALPIYQSDWEMRKGREQPFPGRPGDVPWPLALVTFSQLRVSEPPPHMLRDALPVAFQAVARGEAADVLDVAGRSEERRVGKVSCSRSS